MGNGDAAKPGGGRLRAVRYPGFAAGLRPPGTAEAEQPGRPGRPGGPTVTAGSAQPG